MPSLPLNWPPRQFSIHSVLHPLKSTSLLQITSLAEEQQSSLYRTGVNPGKGSTSPPHHFLPVYPGKQGKKPQHFMEAWQEETLPLFTSSHHADPGLYPPGHITACTTTSKVFQMSLECLVFSMQNKGLTGAGTAFPTD